LIGCILLPINIASAKNNAELDELRYSEKFEFRVLETRPDGLQFEIINNNTEMPTDHQLRVTANGIIAVPPESTIQLEVIDGEWVTYARHVMEGPLKLTQRSTLGEIPPALNRPTT